MNCCNRQFVFHYVGRLQINPLLSILNIGEQRNKQFNIFLTVLKIESHCHFSHISETFPAITKLYSGTLRTKINIFVILATSCSVLKACSVVSTERI
jgi:hypothetical protein